jgi:hypothetical protein
MLGNFCRVWTYHTNPLKFLKERIANQVTGPLPLRKRLRGESQGIRP